MPCLVEVTDEFVGWFHDQPLSVQEAVAHSVGLLEELGTRLPFPHSSAVQGSRHGHMRELRIQSGGDPYRIFYAFDPRRIAILLIAGNKAGQDRFDLTMVPWADQLYDAYLAEIRREGLLK